MDPKRFKAPFILKERVWEIADKFREQYWRSKEIPIDMYHIVEFGLNLEYRFIDGLRETGDTDALLLGDLKTIAIDKNDFWDERSQNRLRFSIAHEVGHLVLHADIFSNIGHSTVEKWIEFIQLLPDDEYGWIEFHAYEFAGRLLVPPERLRKEFQRTLAFAEGKGFTEWDTSGDVALEYISKNIAKIFAVSDEVIGKRLLREQLWPPK